VCAWVVADGVTAGELERWCRERLPAQKVPRRWRMVPALPRSEGGKLLRRRLESASIVGDDEQQPV
jgi:long-chain acyl-CoA synthetase